MQIYVKKLKRYTLSVVCVLSRREEENFKISIIEFDVVQAKKGLGGSTFSMASATMYFIHKLCSAIHHDPHVIISAYVESTVTKARFFSNEILLGPRGIHKNLGYGTVTKLEQELIDKAVEDLRQDIALAEAYVEKNAK